jgi:DNA-binding LacI/PurR family transcriptional regulator
MTKLSDIALACDLDISTVSRALQNDPRVKAETKEIVLKKADELKYKPNFAARNLARGKTDAIVLLLPSINDKWSIEIAKNASKLLMAEAKDLIILMHHDNRDSYKRILERINRGYCDGAIIIPSVNEIENKILIDNIPHDIPTAFVDRWVQELQIPVITSDNLFAVEELSKKLFNEGCHTIINGFSKTNEVTRERHRGVTSAAKKLGFKEVSPENASSIQLKDSTIGIISTSQNQALQIAKDNLKLISENQVFFACFEEWHGEPLPAKKVFICTQDFKSIIEKALQVLLNSKEEKISSEIIRVKPKSFFEIQKSF